MKLRIASVCVAFTFFGWTAESLADTSSARFGGIVANGCVLTGIDSGLMVSDDEANILSSTLSGGSQAHLEVLTSAAGFVVSTTAPSAFTVGDSSDTVFESSYSVSGATAASNVGGATQTALNRGSNRLAVDLTASRLSGSFTNGSYEATVVVRCE